MYHLPHSPYYRDRDSEDDLCQDFPTDRIFIDGLHAMQAHFYNNGVYIDIPVVRVMNTAHYIAAYMFATTCSGDQMEYDVLAYDSFGRDKQLVPLTMIVLAAMLKRTEGFRARNCRNLILDNRDPDFEEGVTLYDRFLRSAEERFAEEDFLIDVNTLVTRVQDQDKQIAQLTSENIQLKYTITTMEEKYQQINIGTQNVNYGTINNYYGFSPSSSSSSAASDNHPKEDSSFASDNLSDSSSSAASDNHPKEDSSFASDNLSDSSSSSLFCRITKAAYDKGVAQQVDDDLRSASVSAPKLVKALNTNDALGYTDTKNLPSTKLYKLLDEHYGLPFKPRAFQNARSK